MKIIFFFRWSFFMRFLLPPLLFCLTFGLMLLAGFFFPLAHWLPAPFNWGGALFIIAGLVIASWHARLFSQLGTNIGTFEQPDILVKAGLYRYTRNPMYLGFLIALCGAAVILASASPWFFVICFIVITDRWYIAYEEKMMLQKFGDEYRLYQQQVRRWL
jgi:protein-S-isoprenylcysteine O-methyltransferase Ste14